MAAAKSGRKADKTLVNRVGVWVWIRGRLLLMFWLWALVVACNGCGYVKFATKQGGYHLKHRINPSQHNLKHMITRQTFFVYGRLLTDQAFDPALPVAVAAFSDRFRGNEMVDLSPASRIDSYYGLNLPPGHYTLVAAADRNGDQRLTATEILGTRRLELDPGQTPQMVRGDVDIQLGMSDTRPEFALEVALEPHQKMQDSLFYPKGSIRSLDDPIFSPQMATLGMYAPALFLEKAPMMFYALAEHRGHKVPVVFVHGIDGSAAQFKTMVGRLDPDRYQAWFFHYPSGADLHQTATFFHRIFLSGKVVQVGETPLVIVAHSMGGIVVREALNLIKPNAKANKVDQFISLASPFGGHPGAKTGTEKAPMVLPSWYDLNPDSRFIAELFRRPLPDSLKHHLFFATGPANASSKQPAGDGVVPLSSQRDPRAVAQAFQDYEVAADHAGILTDPNALDTLVPLISQTKSHFPDAHLRYLMQGGFDVSETLDLTPLEHYALAVYGRYLEALVQGVIVPFHEDQRHFLEAVAGRVRPTNHFETAWRKWAADD